MFDRINQYFKHLKIISRHKNQEYLFYLVLFRFISEFTGKIASNLLIDFRPHGSWDFSGASTQRNLIFISLLSILLFAYTVSPSKTLVTLYTPDLIKAFDDVLLRDFDEIVDFDVILGICVIDNVVVVTLVVDVVFLLNKKPSICNKKMVKIKK